MSYKITFDEKAKEIIKTVVNNGDTPTPTPTEDSCKPAYLAPGHYKFYADKLLEVLIAKNIDVDAEIESGWNESGLAFALAFNNNNSAFTNRADYFGLSTYPDSGLHCELRIVGSQTIYFSEDPEVLTYKAILTEISRQYSKGIDIYVDQYDTFTYIPVIGLQTSSTAATDGYSLTNAEFDTILKYIDEAEYPSEL